VEVPRDRRHFFISASPRPRRSTRAQAAKPKIATIGAGRSLGTLFAKEGFQVMFSSRNHDNTHPCSHNQCLLGMESGFGQR
jgi:hypothetical protein